MAKDSFLVNISPLQVKKIIEKESNLDNFDCDEYDLGNRKNIIVIILEKYYWRNSSRAGLVVVCDNVKNENTLVKVTSTGSSEGIIFSFDWGAGENFVNLIKSILVDYIVEN